MACMYYTGKLLKLTRNKKEANTMLNVFMNAMCRFGHGFISLYHRSQAYAGLKKIKIFFNKRNRILF